MAKELKTRNIFLDTQPFRSRNFSFDGQAMKSLIELAKKGTIWTYLLIKPRDE